jgi:hypothetical protein
MDRNVISFGNRPHIYARPEVNALDDQQARRGAWLELATDDPVILQHTVLEAGLARVEYNATKRFYFAAPGGQVFGIVRREA